MMKIKDFQHAKNLRFLSMKKYIAVLLFAILIFSVMSVSAFAACPCNTKAKKQVVVGSAVKEQTQTQEQAGQETNETEETETEEIEEEETETEAVVSVKNKVKERFEEAKNKFAQAKIQLGACEENETDCEQARKRIKEHAGDYLAKTVDKVIASLERIRKRTQNEGVIAELDAKIAAMEALKAAAEEGGENVKEVAKQIRNEWKNTHRVMKNAVNKIYGNKIGEITQRADNLEIKLERILAKLESKEINTSVLEEDLAEFAEIIANAKALKEAGEYKEAHSALKEAHFVLKELVVGIKQAAGGEEALEETETEETEEETEEEGVNETEETEE